ncbi:CsbD family protein [Pseudomonas aeruginosa]|uniref:CsbD family protein n=1 Tax=Pseudomonas aeruginosa TaxID=287 RepID=UPI0023B3356D|nr:CsbD family protein [Pseudomonas aeruginosa]MDE9764283.1 CsbD family protein [Pseudomonas aeruginosa]
MNSDVIKGKWKQLTGKIKERWGDLTDDDLQAADGHAEYLVGKLQERYGWSKDRAEQEVRDFSDRL